MRVPVHESLAGKPAGQGRPAKHCRNRKVCTQKSSVCARMYPAETKEKQYQINKKGMY